MIANQVRDIHIPLGDLPYLHQDATVREAFDLLHRQHTSGGWRYRHLMVFDADETLVGIISLRDLIRALMPPYLKTNLNSMYSGPLPDDAALSLIWQESFQSQCQYLAEAKVSKYMATVLDTVQIDAPLTRAAYLLVAHRVDMLPVLEGERVVGIVRIVDIFNQAAEKVLHGC
jgi:CBS domain-containing protein